MGLLIVSYVSGQLHRLRVVIMMRVLSLICQLLGYHFSTMDPLQFVFYLQFIRFPSDGVFLRRDLEIVVHNWTSTLTLCNGHVRNWKWLFWKKKSIDHTYFLAMGYHKFHSNIKFVFKHRIAIYSLFLYSLSVLFLFCLFQNFKFGM